MSTVIQKPDTRGTIPVQTGDTLRAPAMPLRDWFRPPRQLMLVFLAVALVSTGALGWLTWHLLAEDQASERQRRLDELDHAADTAVAAMGRDVAALDRLLDTARPSADPGPQAR